MILETNRLLLREFTLDDTPFIIELLNSPGWIEFIGDRNVKTEEQAKLYLQNGPLKSYKENGFGLSMVQLKDGNTPIGMCGIIRRHNLDGTDIGFAFLPEFISKGYGYEIAWAVLKHAKAVLQLPTILAITVPHNRASIKLLEKIGLKFVKLFHFPDSEEELLLYST
jgi:RimJ/RimL family protein N-acetyltransferase